MVAHIIGTILLVVVGYVLLKHAGAFLGTWTKEVHGVDGDYPGRRVELLAFRICAIVMAFLAILLIALTIKKG